MTWLTSTAPGDTDLDRVFGLAPGIYARYRDLYEQLWSRKAVSPVLLEVCRLRIAQLIGCPPELAHRTPAAQAAGLTEEKIAALRQWPSSPHYSAVERACLSFAECYVIDAHAVTDEQCAALNEHLSPEEIAALTTAIAVFDAMARFQVALDV
ncbi:MAG TPA: carboxymuconolactone decarboxylase family protein [Acidimicrobiales bacterium]|jgi:alkylhydroperoxidase family enzyme|nr:carboxymuconolactone decarboxylase family protein [Acidimicrobiales bacterium]